MRTDTETLPDSPIRVLVVDDHESVRSGLCCLLRGHPEIHVVEAVSSGDEALAYLDRARVDVVVLDYRLPGRDGAAICGQIVRRWPRVAALMLSSADEDDIILASLASGATGFLLKSGRAADVAEAVRRVARGEAVLDPEIVPRVMEWARAIRHGKEGDGMLAPIEIDVLSLLAQGWSNGKIASELRISHDTVKARVRSIRLRLGASDRAHAVALATKRGLV